METQQKILSHHLIPHHTYLEQYCFQKESLDGLAQCSGVHVVDVVCIFSQCPSQMIQLC